MWKYYAFKFAGFTLSYLPWSVGYLVARIVADVVYILSPGIRTAVSDNIRHVIGSGTDNIRIRKTTRQVMRNAAKNYFDLLKVTRIRLSEIKERITVTGWQNLEDAIDRSKGVILVTAHLGSFDIASKILAHRSFRTTVLVEPLDPPPLLEHITSLRNSKGLTFMPVRFGILKEVIQSLRAGNVILLACDRDFGGDGLKLSFFGEETSLPMGAVRIAMRTGAAVVPVYNLRLNGNRYEVFFEPALEIIPGNVQESLEKNMHNLAQVLERMIKTCPEQWVVLSHIWQNNRERLNQEN